MDNDSTKDASQMFWIMAPTRGKCIFEDYLLDALNIVCLCLHRPIPFCGEYYIRHNERCVYYDQFVTEYTGNS